MRPFVPPSINAAGAEPSEQARTLLHAEEAGRNKGRQQGETTGHARGFTEGEAQVRAELEPRIAALEAELQRRQTEDSLADTLRKVLVARTEDRAASEIAGAAALHAAIRLIFPVLSQADEGREAIALVRTALAERAADKLVVKAHPDTLARLRSVLQPGRELAEKAEQLELIADQKCESGAAAISWQYGGVYYEPHTLLANITKALKPTDAGEEIGIGEQGA
jgi:flagellar biosynthesis/type III secretory pathway protein FliH